MKLARNRRIATITVGVLAVALVAFVAVGLLFEDSWPGRALRGAGVVVEREPTSFPSAEVQWSGTVTQSEGLGGGLAGTPVTLEGLWDGHCKIWGSDANHPGGAKYIAGTFKMSVQGVSVQGYCIEADRNINTGDSYQANVSVSAEPGLCTTYWILANYRREAPGPGLSGKEEGAAIQAAIWHFTSGFQPLWDGTNWCGRQAVYERALAIIGAAQGKCLVLPANLSLTAATTTLPPGQAADLAASVADQLGRPYQGQSVDFATSLGSLGAAAAVSDAQGQVHNSLTWNQTNNNLAWDQTGAASVTASVGGTSPVAVVAAVSEPKQRVAIVRPTIYRQEASVEIRWQQTISLNYFRVEGQSAGTGIVVGGAGTTGGLTLAWETAFETDNQGFNLYRGPAPGGPWTKLNAALIPSQVPPGSGGGAAYQFVDPAPNRRETLYLLEAIHSSGSTSRFGPIPATVSTVP